MSSCTAAPRAGVDSVERLDRRFVSEAFRQARAWEGELGEGDFGSLNQPKVVSCRKILGMDYDFLDFFLVISTHFWSFCSCPFSWFRFPFVFFSFRGSTWFVLFIFIHSNTSVFVFLPSLQFFLCLKLPASATLPYLIIFQGDNPPGHMRAQPKEGRRAVATCSNYSYPFSEIEAVSLLLELLGPISLQASFHEFGMDCMELGGLGGFQNLKLPYIWQVLTAELTP